MRDELGGRVRVFVFDLDQTAHAERLELVAVRHREPRRLGVAHDDVIKDRLGARVVKLKHADRIDLIVFR